MASNGAVAVFNGVTEMLVRMFGDLNFEFDNFVPSLISGVFVGGCTLVGGFLGGRLGLLAGGVVGSYISNSFGPQIQTLGEMLQQLAVDQLRDLFNLLYSEIRRNVINVLYRSVNSLTLENLLEIYGAYPQINSIITETITNYFRGIYGNNLRLLSA